MTQIIIFGQSKGEFQFWVNNGDLSKEAFALTHLIICFSTPNQLHGPKKSGREKNEDGKVFFLILWKVMLLKVVNVSPPVPMPANADPNNQMVSETVEDLTP